MNDALGVLHIHQARRVHAYKLDNGYPSSRDDGNVLIEKANEHQHE